MSLFRPLAVVLLILCCASPGGAQERDPDALIEQAMKFADLYNWIDAAPLFAEAERHLANRPDTALAMYARLGRIRSTMEQLSLPETSALLEAELENNPLLQTDRKLRLFCLTVKGDIDGEIDSAPARRSWEAALQLARELGDAKWENRASGELGFVAFLEGDVAKAQQMIASALVNAVGSKDAGAQMRYLAAIGTGLAWTGLPEQALGYFDRASAVAAQFPESGYQFLIATGKAIALKELGRLDEAESLLDELIEQSRANQRHVKETQALLLAADISNARKAYPRAIEQLRRAVRLAEDGRFLRLFADAQFQLSAAYRATGDLEQAEAFASAAVTAARGGGEIYELPERLQYLAQLEVSLGKYAEADATYARAADFVDTMVGGVSKAATKGALITASSRIFTEHFALIASHLKDVGKAYEVLERVRGRATTDLIRSAPLPSDHDRAVDREVSRLRLNLLKAASAEEVRRIRDDIFIVEQSRWISPAGVEKGFSHQPIPLSGIRGSLGNDEAILAYVLSAPRSYCLIITRGAANIVALSSRDTIENAADAYLKTIRSKKADTETGRRLFDMLLGPVAEFADKDRLIVVRDGLLHLLPFDALIDQDGLYVAQTHTIAYATSASGWYLLRAKPETGPAGRNLVAVGGVPYDEDLSKIASSRGYGPDGLGNLPGSKDEVVAAAEAMRSIGDSTVLVGREATEYAFKNTDLDQHRLIHMAVHGLANHDRPDQAALILLSDAVEGEDGILQASEILQLRLTADLVVLSACDTAIGRIQGAEGIANLSRAFLLAGARSVVATLWAIDDTFTLNLMKQFYQHLVGGKPVAEALTDAKRDMLQTFGVRAVPYYWAGFTLEGDGRSGLTQAGGRE